MPGNEPKLRFREAFIDLGHQFAVSVECLECGRRHAARLHIPDSPDTLPPAGRRVQLYEQALRNLECDRGL